MTLDIAKSEALGADRMNGTKKHIHLSGICGTAMASLAGLLQLEGHRITGSDKAAYPPMSDLLRDLGIPVYEPYAESNLGGNQEPVPDLVVIGNALSRGNPKWSACSTSGLRLRRWRRCCEKSFCAGANRSSSQARTARLRPRACWHGSIRRRRATIPHSSRRS